MTPKEKAEDVFVRMYQLIPDYVIQENSVASELAKQCALIAVDEIIPLLNTRIDEVTATLFWEQVKEELIKL